MWLCARVYPGRQRGTYGKLYLEAAAIRRSYGGGISRSAVERLVNRSCARIYAHSPILTSALPASRTQHNLGVCGLSHSRRRCKEFKPQSSGCIRCERWCWVGECMASPTLFRGNANTVSNLGCGLSRAGDACLGGQMLRLQPTRRTFRRLTTQRSIARDRAGFGGATCHAPRLRLGPQPAKSHRPPRTETGNNWP
jgi:hypothetical protein